ncbi:MAG: TRAM domain-containing protein [Simkaniaceae bacterium]|nr:TRAM domain-containing protein [Simkaniaceae bacterium]
MMSLPDGTPWMNALIGVTIGTIFSLLLISFDTFFRRFNLRSFNIAIIGLLIGYLMGHAIVLVFNAILEIMTTEIRSQTLEIIKIALFLFGTYLGTIMTIRASDELYISIPFVKFAPTAQKKKDVLVDGSVLSDARIIDLCSTGLLDKQLITPRFLIKELYSQLETGDEMTKSKARLSLDVINKLEHIPNLGIRFNDTDFPEVVEITNKNIRLARLLDANILTADINKAQIASIEGINVINLHALSNALKPLMTTGENIKIKVQRYGKEPRQGVGYLDDGTMVVINGGGNFIGEIIDAQVLSVKHTTSGRMIFCNAQDGDDHPEYHYEEENKD